MNHAQLQAAVTAMCDVRGLWWMAVKDSRWLLTPKWAGDKPGWVDLLILGGDALLVELKTDQGRREMPQINLALRVVTAGLQYRLWRERDLHSGTIEQELNAIII